MAQQPGLDRQTVQRTCHHLEGAQTAFRRSLAERRVHGEKFEKITGCHGLCHGFVENRTFRRKAIGAVGPELVGKIAAGHKNSAAAQCFHRLGHALTQPVVVQRGKAGQAHSQNGAVHPCFAQKIQRDQHAVIEARVSLAQCSGLQAHVFGPADDFLPQRFVVLRLNAHLGRAEGCHGTVGAAAWCDVEVIPI